MTSPLPPGATIGILGGGQLGRMAALAASDLGYKCHIFSPDADAPAKEVSGAQTTAPYEDLDAARKFAQSVDVVTFEFENVPDDVLAVISELSPVRPSAEALHVS
ncbi:MAG: 5-(carboxyamino)imidazole ribonucleotide synthase, partial [Pseudomonadota bacterium]|nr:5-(carboxyamino)imidazole ribonucleotide synthase [Pseudomonadota bacterium]